MKQALWIDRSTLRVLRVAVDLPGDTPTLQADYRYGEEAFPAWKEVEVSVGHRPLFLARMRNVAINRDTSRIPRAAMLRRPGGERDVDRRVGLVWSDLPAWQQSVVGTLNLILAVLAARFLRHRLRRQLFSREFILVDREGGSWEPRLRRLGFPVAPFSPEIMSRELRGLGRGVAADAGRLPRAVLVAPNGCEGIAKHTYLLQSYVEEGGRVLLMEHGPPALRFLPFSATMVALPEGAARTVFSDRGGPWRRVTFDEAGHFVAAMGSGNYYESVGGRLLDWEIVALAGSGGTPRGVALGVALQGRGQWILCQVALSVSSVARKSLGERFVRDVLDYVQGRRLLLPGLEDEPKPV